jgi:hypothetical protein
MPQHHQSRIDFHVQDSMNFLFRKRIAARLAEVQVAHVHFLGVLEIAFQIELGHGVLVLSSNPRYTIPYGILARFDEGGTDFSLWVLVLARSNPDRLKPVLLKTQCPASKWRLDVRYLTRVNLKWGAMLTAIGMCVRSKV